MTDALRRLFLLAACGVVLQVTAVARPIHYGAVTDPGLLECDRYAWQGSAAEADDCYAAIRARAVDAARMAEAAWAMNDRQDANRLYRLAVAADPDNAMLRVRWGDLFAAAHQNADAIELYREALDAEPGNAWARLGIARVLIASFDPAGSTVLAELVADTGAASGARIGALLLSAHAALESGNVDRATTALDETEELLQQGDWPPLDVYALRAAADLVAGTGSSRWTEAALAYNPQWGGIFATPAHFYVITRRYREAIDLYQQAVDIEPALAAAHENLGINLLRDNQVSRARKHLEIAYSEDPFSPRAVNTLRLLDSFSRFRLMEDMPMEPGEVPVVLRLREDEANVIAPYAVELVRDSIDVFSERYGFRLREPVVIEMYPDHEDFAVRTAGMPGLGILGAAFGYVVAMDSPSARAPIDYQWGTTLWHEMAHVFTLGATGHLVPRWFSEGISVFEEWRTGPTPGIRLPMAVYNAIGDEKFLPVAELDEGFIRPTYDGQVLVSYMQAGLVCDFIDRNFGPSSLRDLLAAFGAGLDTAAAIESVFGISPKNFDSRFAAHIEAEHGAFVDSLPEWQQQREALAEDLDAGRWAEARATAEALLEMLPGYVEADSPYLALARIHDELDEPGAATAALEAFWSRGGFAPGALMDLASRFVAGARQDDAIRVLETVTMIDPLEHDVHAMLGEQLLDAGRADAALRAFEVALALDPHDKATAWYRIALARQQLGDIDGSQQGVLEALDIAPGFRPAQRLLLELASD